MPDRHFPFPGAYDTAGCVAPAAGYALDTTLAVERRERDRDRRACPPVAPPVATVDRVVGRTRQDVVARINALRASAALMEEYLLLKQAEHDWHGCQDAGSDLRDIEAEIKGLQWVLGDEAEP